MNQNLEAYYDAWDKFIKAWIVIKIKDPNCVYQWRLQVSHWFAISEYSYPSQYHFIIVSDLQAEIAMKADGKPGMSDEEVGQNNLFPISFIFNPFSEVLFGFVSGYGLCFAIFASLQGLSPCTLLRRTQWFRSRMAPCH